MTYTFTLQVIDSNTNEPVYAEFHNFRILKDSCTYYRGGATHPLEIEITKESAEVSMAKLKANGWTCKIAKRVYTD